MLIGSCLRLILINSKNLKNGTDGVKMTALI